MNDPFAGPIGLIINPRSRRNRDRLAKVRAGYRSAERLIAHEIDDVRAIPAVLAEFQKQGTSLIAVSGGDGTVQAAMTELIASYPDTGRPPLVVLSGGMTNVTGHQIGVAGQPEQGLAALLQRRKEGGKLSLISHPVLKVHVSPGSKPLYGMLIGGAAFFDATMMARSRVHPVGFAQSSAAVIAGVAYFLKTFLGRSGGGHRMRLRLDDNGGPAGQCYLFFLSCLPGLILGLDPFWGEGIAPLRWTWVDHPPRHIAFATIPLLCGKPRKWMLRSGYRSGRACRIEIESDTPLFFDGERINPAPGLPVVVESGQMLTFARLQR